MMKPTVLALALCAPNVSLANPPPQRQLKFQLTVKHTAATRTHQLLLLDRTCGSVKEKSATHEDDIDVCAEAVQGDLRLRVQWFVRQGPSEYRTKWESVVAKKGGTVEVGRVGGTRLTLQMQETAP
ncbi:MAG TPA: hypothetical protein VIU61_31095 [Kofleriaceae bacterium]